MPADGRALDDDPSRRINARAAPATRARRRSRHLPFKRWTLVRASGHRPTRRSRSAAATSARARNHTNHVMTAHVPWRQPAGVIEPRRPDHAPTLLPSTPLAELDALRRLDQAYERRFDGESRTWAPAIDVERGAKALTVRADVRGVAPVKDPVTITPAAA